MGSFSDLFAHIGCEHITGCAFNQFQLQMHKLKPYLLVQLGLDPNAQPTGST